MFQNQLNKVCCGDKSIPKLTPLYAQLKVITLVENCIDDVHNFWLRLSGSDRFESTMRLFIIERETYENRYRQTLKYLFQTKQTLTKCRNVCFHERLKT